MDATSEPPGWEPPGGSQAGGDAGGTGDWGGVPPLQPMGLGDLLDGAFKLFRANLGSVLLIAAVFLVPLELLGVLLARHLATSSVQHLQDLANSSGESGPDSDAVRQSLRDLFATLSVAILPFLLAAKIGRASCRERV